MTTKGQRSPQWCLFGRLTIRVPAAHGQLGRIYLDRLRILDTPWFGIYLHRMVGPDWSPHNHDHPWPFVSFVLRGGYIENVSIDTHHFEIHMNRYVRWFNAKRATDKHRIVWIEREPTWTLVLRGKRVREWGFWTGEGEEQFVPFREYEDRYGR
jgi:hypothetical protein